MVVSLKNLPEKSSECIINTAVHPTALGGSASGLRIEDDHECRTIVADSHQTSLNKPQISGDRKHHGFATNVQAAPRARELLSLHAYCTLDSKIRVGNEIRIPRRSRIPIFMDPAQQGGVGVTVQQKQKSSNGGKGLQNLGGTC